MIFDGVHTDVFQYYLDHLAQEIPAVDSKRRVGVLHKTGMRMDRTLPAPSAE